MAMYFEGQNLSLLVITLLISQWTWETSGQQIAVVRHQVGDQDPLDQVDGVTMTDTPYLDLEIVSQSLQINATTDEEEETTLSPLNNNSTEVEGGTTQAFMLPGGRPILGENSGKEGAFLWTQNREGYSSTDKALLGYVFQSTEGKSSMFQCALECLKHTRCSSFNFYSASHLCELSDSSHAESSGSLVDLAGCEYHVKTAFSIDTLALGPCADDPCSGKGRCLETRSVSGELTYLCLCDAGWAGADCGVPAADPQWSDWGLWSACSVTCHRGWRMRTRDCEDSTNGVSLSPSQCYGASQEYGVCELQQCPRWESWGAWGECSTEKTCGSGVKVRQRACSNGGTVGVDRYCLGLVNESTPCTSVACNGPMRLTGGSAPGEGRVEVYDDQHQQWALICADQMTSTMATMVCRQLGWPGAHAAVTDGRFGPGSGQFGLTSVTCGGSGETLAGCEHNEWTTAGICHGGATIAAGVQCDVNGVWGLWSAWSQCSVSCEDGIQTRTRLCDHPPRLHGGRDCEGESIQTKNCTLDKCPVDGVWEPWLPWGACSVTCGNGTQTRDRECHGPFYDGDQCQGEANQTRDCMDRHCPVHGVWDEWSTWGECNQTCAGGTRTRDRNCTEPMYGGQPCVGSYQEEESCNTHACPVDGIWLQWQEWGNCSVSCGGGTRQRTRTCKEPQHGGLTCDGTGIESEDCNQHKCPIDGIWSDWTEWTECTVTCGNGTQWRNRTCDGPFHLGKPCEGDDNETQVCMPKICPVDGQWLSWGGWGDCSKACGNGIQERFRYCEGPSYGGDDCTGPGHEDRECNTHSCPVDGKWLHWSDWSNCSATCGGGNQSRDRECLGPFHGGMPCDGHGEETRICNTFSCPEDGYFSEWSAWGTCDAACAGGLHTRNRFCLGPYHGGKDCQGPYSDTGTCNTHPCPIDGVFTQWTAWSYCSVTCGGGLTNRSRDCDGPEHGGKDCEGPRYEDKACNEQSCPEDGAWLPWSQWEECSVPCGGGIQTRNRTCIGVQHGGDYCRGDHDQTRACNTHYCPVDGTWKPWSDWDKCSVTCGGGLQARNRSCDGPYHQGLDCQGHAEENQTCNIQPCPIDGYYGEWTAWSHCSLTCGGGTQSRTRTCIAPEHQGKDCEGPGNETQDCNIQPCPVDGEYLDWSAWGECSVSCGGGLQWRNRTCQPPRNGGADCSGPDTDSQECKTQACPRDGVWLAWSEWSLCTATCGGGQSERTRHCQPPEHGGTPCSGPGRENTSCAEDPCPIAGEWYPWTEWTSCAVTCGGGTRYRERQCDIESYGNLTAPCEGEATETLPCHDFDCLPYAETCSELAEKGLRESNLCEIDVDGPGIFTLEPVVVYCDMETDGGVGVTVVGHDQEERMMVQGLEAADGVKLNYNISFDHVLELVDRSGSCKQYISWECYAALIHNKNGQAITGWLTREEDVADYFGGATPGSKSCACGMNNTCVEPDLKCNCDANDLFWRQDEGFLTFKDDLPVFAFMAGDTDGKNENGYKQIGPILCQGKETRPLQRRW